MSRYGQTNSECDYRNGKGEFHIDFLSQMLFQLVSLTACYQLSRWKIIRPTKKIQKNFVACHFARSGKLNDNRFRSTTDHQTKYISIDPAMVPRARSVNGSFLCTSRFWITKPRHIVLRDTRLCSSQGCSRFTVLGTLAIQGQRHHCTRFAMINPIHSLRSALFAVHRGARTLGAYCGNRGLP
jgi:hypothetical protein